jgi:hypothetical protein
VEPKSAEQTLTDWYLVKDSTARGDQVVVLKSKSGNEVIQSPDKLTSYIEAGDRVITMRYDLGRDRMMQYRSTFFMMVQSLAVTEATAPIAVPVEGSISVEADETEATEPATLGGSAADGEQTASPDEDGAAPEDTVSPEETAATP